MDQFIMVDCTDTVSSCDQILSERFIMSQLLQYDIPSFLSRSIPTISQKAVQKIITAQLKIFHKLRMLVDMSGLWLHLHDGRT